MRADQPRPHGARWGLVTRVVPRAELDATVAELAANLRRKLPEALRYTKTQLNWWRDLVWAQTVTHARDWLAVHSTADETREAVAAFHAKRAAATSRPLRRLAGRGGPHLPVLRGHRACPRHHAFCGGCGAALEPAFESVP